RLQRDLGASVAVHWRFPLLDASLHRTSTARDASRRAEEIRSGAETTRLRRRMLTLLAGWRVAFQRVEATRRTRESAEANLLRMKSLYSAGGTRLLDLLDARRVFDESRQRLADAQEQSRILQFEAEDTR